MEPIDTRTRSPPDAPAVVRPDGAGHRHRGARRRCSDRTLLAAAPADQARDPKTGGLAGLPHFAPKAKRVIYLHQSGGPSQLETVRLQAGARASSRARRSPTRSAWASASPQTMGQSSLPVARRCSSSPARPVGHVGQRAAAAHREDRRRHHRHQDDEHRGDQPRSGDHVHPDRLPAARPAEHGRVAQLRPGQREPEPAGVRRAAVAGARASTPISRCSRGCGRAASCRRATRACGSAPAATRCCTSTIRRASTKTTRRADARRGRRS